MKNLTLAVFGFCLMLFACNTEQIELSEDSLSEIDHKHKKKKKDKVNDAVLISECIVIDADRSPFGSRQPASNFWWSKNSSGSDYFDRSTYFSSTDANSLVFKEYDNGTASISGTTVNGTCMVTVDVWLKDEKTWDQWSALGGGFKKEGTAGNAANAENMRFYVIDSQKSTVTAEGGDCVETGTFGLEQRPDPNDPNTPNFGAHIGPGGANYDSNIGAIGLSTWGWLTELPTVVNEDCNDCDGKLNALTLQYNGNSDATIKVIQKKDNLIAFEGMVESGGSFSFLGKDDKGTLGTEITIYVDGIENTKMHTSCSDPNVIPGHVSGDFLVTAGSSRNGGTLCPSEIIPGERLYLIDFNFRIDCQEVCDECEGGVTSFTAEYNGDSPSYLKVEHKKAILFEGTVNPGDEIPFAGAKSDGKFEENDLIFTLNGVPQSAPEHKPGKVHMSCSKPFYVGLPIGNEMVVTSGTSRYNGAICEDTPPEVPDCMECEGKVTNLELKYLGDSSASIMVKTKEKKKKKKKKHEEMMNPIVFDGNVDAGDTFSFEGNDDKGTLGTEITIYVDGVISQKIHTSCSVPIGPGAIFGNFEVISGYSREGGKLCPSDYEEEKEEEKCDCKGKIVEMSVIYDGPNGAEIIVTGEKGGSQTFSDVQSGAKLTPTLGNVGNWYYYAVNGAKKEASIHTSCSDDILGNVNAEKSDFGDSGTDGGDTFLVISHTDSNGNTCSINAG